MYRFLFLAIGLFFSTFLSAQLWSIKPLDNGVKPAIAVGADGRPHIAYMLEANPGYVRHAVLENGQFTITEVAQSYYYGPLDIALDKNGLPAIAVHNHTDEDENIYRKTATGTWTTLRVEDPGHDGWDSSLAFDGNNQPHTSSVDPAMFGSQNSIEYASYDGVSWHREAIGAGPVPYAFSTSLALDSQGRPHIVFFDQVNDDLKYAKKVNGQWMIENISTAGGFFASLVLDAEDQPHVSYYRVTNGNEGMVFYAWWNGSTWENQPVDMLKNAPIGFTGSRNITSLAMDATGVFHLSYGDRNVVKYAVLKNGTWEIETAVDETETSVRLGSQTSLALGPDGRPHITYFEVTSETPLNGKVKYATKLTTTAVKESPHQIDIKVFPNPTKDWLFIALDRPLPKPFTVELVDVNGKSHHFTDTFTGSKLHSFNTTDLPKGLYFLRLQQAGYTLSKKVMIW
ncbi:MAG: T9SS type A sorting domain-containing protein [Saprospiraceae bacterium]